MAEGHKWKPIADLPEDLEPFRDRELESLSQVWAEQKLSIEGDARIAAFNLELAREWAIETGIIEGVYTLDRGITETLIERGIDSSYIPHDATNRDPELVARIMQGHQAALEGLFAFVKGERELGTSYIKELHVALLQYVDRIVVWDQFGKPFETELEKGVYKKQPNNPRREDGTIHEYCPPEHVASEMDRLIELHRQHESRGVAPHIEGAWLHHAFTQIHPFQDGNGRVARALASLIFIRAGLFPLVVRRDDRATYIEALEAADDGWLLWLATLFSEFQRQRLNSAIRRAADVKPVLNFEDSVEVTRELLANLGKITPKEFLTARARAEDLFEFTGDVLNRAAGRLDADISTQNVGFKFTAAKLDEVPAWLTVICETFDCQLASESYSRSCLLTLVANEISRVVIVFTALHPTFKGLIGVVAYFQSGNNGPIPLSNEMFRIDDKDSVEVVRTQYFEWLDAAMVKGLAEWRRTV
jgi:Fic family protein